MNAGQPAAASEEQKDASATETATKEDADAEKKTSDKKSAAKILMGVIRVGLFAKRIMLDGDLLAELVVVCAQKPTSSLLRRIATLMANDIAVTLLILSHKT